jgi:hypothetical protein
MDVPLLPTDNAPPNFLLGGIALGMHAGADAVRTV